MNRKLFIGLVLTSAPLLAITVSNKSEFDVYAATYYFHKEAKRVGDIKMIPAGEKVEFERPPFSVKKQRQIIFSLQRPDLKGRLSSSEFHVLPNFSIGAGDTFYISLVNGSFEGFNAAQWKALEPIKRKLGRAIKKLDEVTLGRLRKRFTAGKTFPLQNIEVSVRQSSDLPFQEKKFMARRKQQIKPLLEQWLGMELQDSEVPTIALIGSGGGYRAMLGYLGALLGAEDSGLLDVTSYLAGLSGSTWTLGPWISSGWTLDEFRQRLLGKIETDLIQFKPDVSGIMNELLMRVSFKQPVTSVNVYGWILGHKLLNDFPNGPMETYLHQQVSQIQDGSKPMPIYTAVATKLPYQWVEFTPWEFGGDYFGGYIPVRSFGGPFLNGEMRYFTPPYSLSFILAICGSALGARLNEMIQRVEGSIPFAPLRKALVAGTEEFGIGKYRPMSAQVFNWTWGMRPLPRAQQEIIKLVDAGIAYNLPLEAIYRRKPDIIIITDFSTAEPGKQLRKAEKDLRARGFRVPPITYDGIGDKPFSVFKDPADPTTPVIIYFPHISNPSYSTFNPQECRGSWCSTFNFKYSRNQAKQLIGLTKHTIKEATDALKEEIRLRIQAQRN